MPLRKKSISCSFEIAARSVGFKHICGVDEAGRGPLAGPVVAAAVILAPGCNIAGIDDSKKLSAATRERLFDSIIANTIAWSIEFVGVEIIDKINILNASLLAMRLAVERLHIRTDFIFVDGRHRIPGLAAPVAQMELRGGDARCVSIAAASILAKVARDRHMAKLDAAFPGYGFAQHKGYGTASHMECIARLGPCPEHRRSFEPVKSSQIEIFGKAD